MIGAGFPFFGHPPNWVCSPISGGRGCCDNRGAMNSGGDGFPLDLVGEPLQLFLGFGAWGLLSGSLGFEAVVGWWVSEFGGGFLLRGGGGGGGVGLKGGEGNSGGEHGSFPTSLEVLLFSVFLCNCGGSGWRGGGSGPPASN